MSLFNAHILMISCRLASILVEFAREVKEAHMIILAEKATKKVSFIQTSKLTNA